MTYQIVLEKKALKFILKQPLAQRIRIFAALGKLPNEGDIQAMAGAPAGRFRLRVGTYRIIYTIENAVLTIRIMDAGNRGDIYK